MESQGWSIDKYVTINGLCPFCEWFETLQPATQARVDVRLDRVNLGNFGDRQSLGEGIYELRLHFGGGYRIYYGISVDILPALKRRGFWDQTTLAVKDGLTVSSPRVDAPTL